MLHRLRDALWVIEAYLTLPLRRWFIRCHGIGASNQDELYRCLGCRRIVTHRMIKGGGCRCGYAKIAPTNATVTETIALLVTPWRFA